MRNARAGYLGPFCPHCGSPTHLQHVLDTTETTPGRFEYVGARSDGIGGNMHCLLCGWRGTDNAAIWLEPQPTPLREVLPLHRLAARWLRLKWRSLFKPGVRHLKG